MLRRVMNFSDERNPTGQIVATCTVDTDQVEEDSTEEARRFTY